MTDSERIRRWFEIAHRESHVHPHLAIHLRDAAHSCEQKLVLLGHIRIALSEWLKAHRGKLISAAVFQIESVIDEIDENLGFSAPAEAPHAPGCCWWFAAATCNCHLAET